MSIWRSVGGDDAAVAFEPDDGRADAHATREDRQRRPEEGRLMSIWASVWKDEAIGEEWDCRASDLHSEAVDEYTGTGPDDLDVGVATATSWNDRVRLNVSERDDGPVVDICLLLSEASAEALRDMLDVALARLRARVADRTDR